MTFVLALWLAASGASAQPGPPPELARFAEDIRRQPTDARSIHPRFRMVMEGVRMRGAPPPPIARRIHGIRALIAEGKLTQAAGELDALVLDMERGEPGPPPPAPERAAPPPAAPEPAPEEHEVVYVAPLLSAPAPKPAIAPLEPPAEAVAPARVPERAEPLARETLVTPPPKSSFPWALTLAGAGLGLLGMAALVYALRRESAPAAAARPAEPTLRQKYQVGALLASGGMGEVYDGRDLSLGRRVAIKKMLPDIKLDASLRGQFAKEARTVAKLAHPYIVQIHECLEEGEDVYLVFEFVEGETLSQRLSREGRLPLKECKRILSFVCQAVDHAHKNHVLHRDLKPANIMLDKSGIARVMDFGIALESTRTATSAGSAGFLDASGTLRYMPPEQHHGSSVRASDVYALGVCLYEMATGQMPFSGGSVEDLLSAKRARRFAPPSSVVPGLPKELDVFMAAVLEPDPRNRVSSAAEFLEALEALP